MFNIRAKQVVILLAVCAAVAALILPLLVELKRGRTNADCFRALGTQRATLFDYERAFGEPKDSFAIGGNDCLEFYLGLGSKGVACSDLGVTSAAVVGADVSISAMHKLILRVYEDYLSGKTSSNCELVLAELVECSE